MTSIALRSQPKVFDLHMYHDFGWAQHPISDVLNQKVYNYNAYALMTVIAEEQCQCPEEDNVKDENDTRPQQPILLQPRPKGFYLMLHREAEMHAMLSQALERCESLKMEAADAQRRAKKTECHCPTWRIRLTMHGSFAWEINVAHSFAMLCWRKLGTHSEIQTHSTSWDPRGT